MTRTHKLFSMQFALIASVLFTLPAQAEPHHEAINVFRAADESGELFQTAQAYAVFPMIGKGGVGGACGKGRDCGYGKVIGDTAMSRLSIGFHFVLGTILHGQVMFQTLGVPHLALGRKNPELTSCVRSWALPESGICVEPSVTPTATAAVRKVLIDSHDVRQARREALSVHAQTNCHRMFEAFGLFEPIPI